MVFLLLANAWAPILVVLHEAAHALAALALTDGEVSVDLRAGGLLGGSATYEESGLRRPRDAAWIFAAGPAVTLVAAVLLWRAWLADPSAAATVVSAGAFTATCLFLTSALPIRYGAGLGGPADSDGRAIWKILTGAPPGGVAREERRIGKPERAVRPVYAVLLAVAGVLGFLVDPVVALALVGLFGFAAVLQRRG